MSFTHFVELLDIDDTARRRFYETEAIRGCWTSRELSRTISLISFSIIGFCDVMC
jgi:predicted nuclease of restriction endonuclease-like (RecB) superfamily